MPITTKKFPSECNPRGVVKTADKVLIWNSDTGASDEYSTVAELTKIQDDAIALKVDKATGERLINAAEIVKLSNTSGTNTGDNATNSQYSGLAASKEDVTNKKSTITNSTTDYPNGKAAFDALALKVDKVTGKGLSTNDYDNAAVAEVAKVQLKINTSSIANNLTETVAGKVLDATQGKVLDEKISASQGNLLGGIAHNASAPTPTVNGRYVFTSAGSCTWITGGARTVSINDEVLVTYTAPSTYVYTYLSVAANFAPLSGGTGYLQNQSSVEQAASSKISGTHSARGFDLSTNDTWLTVRDYAGNIVNLLKISKDNVIEFAQKVGISKLFHVANQGVSDIVDIPVNALSPDNTEHGVSVSVGGKRILKISALSDGAGSVDNLLVTLETGTKIKIGAAAYAIPETDGTSGQVLTTNGSGVLSWTNKA